MNTPVAPHSVHDFDYYTETIRSSFGLPLEFSRAEHRSKSAFRADVRMMRLGTVSAGFIDCDDYAARMPVNDRPRETMSFVFLEAGSTGIGQDGRYAVLRPGQVFFFNTARAADFHFFTHFRQHVLHLPKSELVRLLPGVERRTAVALECTGTLALLRSLVRTASAESASGVAPEALEELSSTLLSLALIGLAQRFGEEAREPPAHSALRLSAERFMNEHLGDESLTAGQIARACGISERLLYQLFKETGGVMKTLRGMRLARAREMLASPRSRHLRLGEVGYACGFRHQAHFSERFREVYGETPGAFRRRTACGES